MNRAPPRTSTNTTPAMAKIGMMRLWMVLGVVALRVERVLLGVVHAPAEGEGQAGQDQGRSARPADGTAAHGVSSTVGHRITPVERTPGTLTGPML